MPEVLRNEIASDHLEIILQDFLTVDVDQAIAQFRQPGQGVVFASNLPYYITTPILFKLFEAKEPIDAITVMMQKEVGQRFLAQASAKEYNALSVIWQYKCDCKKVMDVSRHVFWPSPRVDSVVLQFTFHHKYHYANEAAFFWLVKSCFVQRRKTIYNNLQNALKDKELALQMLEKAGIAPSKRAQQCQLEDLKQMNQVLLRHIKTNHRTRATFDEVAFFVFFCFRDIYYIMDLFNEVNYESICASKSKSRP